MAAEAAQNTMPPQQAHFVNDPWLDRWMALIAERSGGADILELGCGEGLDSERFAGAGLGITGIDLSPVSIAQAQQRVPAGRFVCQDIRARFPVSDCGVIVASLSLHYFPWPETLELVARIRETLRPGGVLLCRLNSVNDHCYGASGHPQIEKDYYLVDGEPKRFFDRDAVIRMFAQGWICRHLEDRVIHRYSKPKSAWEVVLEVVK